MNRIEKAVVFLALLLAAFLAYLCFTIGVASTAFLMMCFAALIGIAWALIDFFIGIAKRVFGRGSKEAPQERGEEQ